MNSKASAPPNLQVASARHEGLVTALALESLLNEALTAHRNGTLDELLLRRPRATRWFVRRYLAEVPGSAGDAWRDASPQAQAVAAFLGWGVSQLRPDRVPGLDGIDTAAWIERTSWRPMLAVMCHYGFAPVRVFRDRYRPRPDETAADHLCGLWSVGQSTFYRYLEKGKRQLAEQLAAVPRRGERSVSLRRFVTQEVYRRCAFEDDAQRRAWHLAQARQAMGAKAGPAALWHALCADDADGFAGAMTRFTLELANHAETDSLLAQWAERPLAARSRVALGLAEAAVWRVRHAEAREQQAYQQALAAASAGEDKLALGRVYGALGKFHEPRDMDRAFACYEDAADFLRQAGLAEGGGQAEAGVMDEYLAVLVRLAWLYVLRNDPRSRAVLDRAEQVRAAHAVQAQNLGMLEQTWGEYWRRASDLPRALQHKHRALNIFERLADTRSMLITYLNLGLIYGEAKEFERALEYLNRILELGRSTALEPEMACSTHLNLGASYFWQGRYDEAIEHYGQALRISTEAQLKLHSRRAHYNLAEAHYKRFQAGGRAQDEAEGDAHAAAALKALPPDAEPARVDAIRGLKADILGPRGRRVDQLMPEEFAAHFEEMAEVQRQRAVLALPREPAAHVEAHLAVARAYLTMSMKERELALALAHKHGLQQRFADRVEDLQATFNRTLTREHLLASQWREASADLLSEERRGRVLERLLHGEPITKSRYAELCGVGLATASKHLGLLAERGLLVQAGKGPSTRYLLPGEK